MSHLVTCFSDAVIAGKTWNLSESDFVSEHLYAFAEMLPENTNQGFRYQLAHALPRCAEVSLMPGPTGETNELYLSGRGVALLIVESADSQNQKAVFQTIGALLGAILSAGNSVILCSDSDELNRSFSTAIDASKLPANLIQLCPYDSYKRLLQMDIRAAALVGNKQAEQEVNKQLATRSGAIVALVSETDPEALQMSQDPNLVLRFVTERTRTINITAVGGNASLLELGGN
ncbi:1-pyrroline-5-carboxylate dehydrogenase [Vibrio hannami]|uniref:1-pyrroline-5-carboxylate dehydrogenase n=1 Tax=Vibrio hannami TaxID=2717094 RepID=UPI00240FEAC7|nr:1-pyrroline-5-carboxylate dehydrogenase [Vibrio hannami]MDG3086295.1 1-pyrroline-5-carboxylate dehydrogenase [Vibrio hannami]